MPTTVTPFASNDAPQSDGQASTFRTPPHNVEAEKALLGAIFANNRAHEKVSEFLRPEHFSIAEHGRIFEAVTTLVEKGQIADVVTLQRYFEQDELLAEIGGPAYLVDLATSVITVGNAGHYGQIVYDLHLKRELINLGEDLVNRAYSGDVEETATGQIESAEQSLYDLATSGEYEGGFQEFKASVLATIELAQAAHKREGALAGVTTGLIDLDKMLGGLHPSDLIILAGRPSMGKTALATNIAYNAAYSYLQSNGEEGAVVGFFSLEMSAEQLAARIISEQTNISSDRMRKGELSNDEFSRLVVGSQQLYKTPFYIDDTPALTVSALRTRARRLKRQHKLGLIVVDYLQLIAGNPTSRNDGRVNEVSEITRGLKTLAKELEVPVIALSQLSRAVEQREDKRPQLSDLRESGSIEQDADIVSFIFREEYYLDRSEPMQRPDEKDDHFIEKRDRWEQRLNNVRNVAEVLVAKQRHGPIGKVELHFQGEFTRFSNLDRSHMGEG
ncbi:MAG: replicative DNA helicase [Rhodospirillaceae bacterium]|jgi:replicative DNA helicase|nr:replicative DNA helicase [Rhodospirillales bacterium]MBT3906832.1 replicative DNA helicase [Rhodospirillaceae bacterium]MBT4702215.1 replicative DNA helicase [Rhodospirillaceae bacterium]MBT5035804.1 replicative DNA helicase [Rhodospirillaceae bacterium]MBT6221959.1 replicative DNA helicase [Rhodospirillaceae bacterium]